jgi:hypothetical protein
LDIPSDVFGIQFNAGWSFSSVWIGGMIRCILILSSLSPSGEAEKDVSATENASLTGESGARLLKSLHPQLGTDRFRRPMRDKHDGHALSLAPARPDLPASLSSLAMGLNLRSMVRILYPLDLLLAMIFERTWSIARMLARSNPFAPRTGTPEAF